MSDGGDCFKIAGRGLLFDELGDHTRRLVHGIVTGTKEIDGIKHVHAWIEWERGGIKFVTDKSNGNDVVVRCDDFYTIGRIDQSSIIRYTWGMVNELVDASEHWGPWDKKLLAFGEPQ